MSSGYWYTRLAEENAALKTSVSTLELKKTKAIQSLDLLKDELKPDAVQVPLDKALASTMLHLYNKRTAYRVSIAQARAFNASGSTAAAEVDKYAETVPGTQLKSVKMSIVGSYADYEFLLGYLSSLRENNPVSIVFLKVDDMSFEMNLRVFGK